MGHGSIFVWVSGSWVTAYNPLPALQWWHRLVNAYEVEAGMA